MAAVIVPVDELADLAEAQPEDGPSPMADDLHRLRALGRVSGIRVPPMDPREEGDG